MRLALTLAIVFPTRWPRSAAKHCSLRVGISLKPTLSAPLPCERIGGTKDRLTFAQKSLSIAQLHVLPAAGLGSLEFRAISSNNYTQLLALGERFDLR